MPMFVQPSEKLQMTSDSFDAKIVNNRLQLPIQLAEEMLSRSINLSSHVYSTLWSFRQNWRRTLKFSEEGYKSALAEMETLLGEV